MPTLEVEAKHLAFNLLAPGLTPRPQLSDGHVTSLAWKSVLLLNRKSYLGTNGGTEGGVGKIPL